MMTKDTAGMLAKLGKFFKSNVSNDALDDLSDTLDMWNKKDGLHTNPTAAQLDFGPAEAACGSGASRMVSDYSTEQTPQQGLSEQYQMFSRSMSEFRKSLALHERAISALMGVFSEARKSTPAADSDSFATRALGKLAKAKASIRKAELQDDDADGKAARSSHLDAATELLAAAKRLLSKAPEHADGDEPEDEGQMEKAITMHRSLAKALAAAKADAKSDDDKGDAGEGEGKDAAAKKSTVTLEDIQASLQGLRVLPSTVSGLMEAVMGRSKNPDPPVMKAGNAPVLDTAARIELAIDNGELSATHEMRATTLLNQLNLAKAGRVSMHDYECELAKAGPEVRRLFSA
jgi:hypothetical protein